MNANDVTNFGLRVTYDLGRAGLLVQVNETLVIIVTPRPEETYLTSAFIENSWVFEPFFLW
jgi:hypothetical protein